MLSVFIYVIILVLTEYICFNQLKKNNHITSFLMCLFYSTIINLPALLGGFEFEMFLIYEIFTTALTTALTECAYAICSRAKVDSSAVIVVGIIVGVLFSFWIIVNTFHSIIVSFVEQAGP